MWAVTVGQSASLHALTSVRLYKVCMNLTLRFDGTHSYQCRRYSVSTSFRHCWRLKAPAAGLLTNMLGRRRHPALARCAYRCSPCLPTALASCPMHCSLAFRLATPVAYLVVNHQDASMQAEAKPAMTADAATNGDHSQLLVANGGDDAAAAGAHANGNQASNAGASWHAKPLCRLSGAKLHPQRI